MPKTHSQRIAATRDLGSEDWLALLPALSVPKRLASLVQTLMREDVMTAPHLVALALEAGTDREAIQFVRTLHQHPLVRIGGRVVSIYPDAHATPEAVRNAFPLMAIEAQRRMSLHHWSAQWLDADTLDVLLAARSRGLRIELELVVTRDLPADPAIVHRLKAAGIRLKSRRLGPGLEKWRTLLPTVAIDGVRRVVY